MPLRKISMSLPTTLILAIVLVLGVLFISQAGASYAAKKREQRTLTHNTSETATLASQSLTQTLYKPTIRIWLHGDSIRPSMIRTTPGVVVLRAENETRSDVSLVVEKVLRGQTMPVASIITTNGGRRARGEFVVEVGEYVYYDAARPRIKGTLIVEPRQ